MIGIKDVAQEAGVSVATVSYYVNGTRPVSEKSARRVEAAIEKLNYTPNYSARSLRTRKNNSIAFITHRLTNEFFPEVIEAVADVAYSHGYSLFLSLTQNRREEELNEFRIMITRQVSGIIIAPAQMDFNYRSLCPDDKFPLVFVDRAPKSQNADSIRCENYNVTYRAITELIQRGHQNIAFLAPKRDPYHNELILTTRHDRFSAYRQALEDHGIRKVHCYEDGLISRDWGYKIMKQILENPEITATFISNNIVAQGAWQCLIDEQISIPKRMALVSFDSGNWSRLVSPTLSTIEQPAAEMGRLAAETIFERIQNPEMTYRRIVLDSKLSLRESI